MPTRNPGAASCVGQGEWARRIGGRRVPVAAKKGWSNGEAASGRTRLPLRAAGSALPRSGDAGRTRRDGPRGHLGSASPLSPRAHRTHATFTYPSELPASPRAPRRHALTVKRTPADWNHGREVAHGVVCGDSIGPRLKGAPSPRLETTEYYSAFGPSERLSPLRETPRTNSRRASFGELLERPYQLVGPFCLTRASR